MGRHRVYSARADVIPASGPTSAEPAASISKPSTNIMRPFPPLPPPTGCTLPLVLFPPCLQLPSFQKRPPLLTFTGDVRRWSRHAVCDV
jgi:hypothetical protein